MKKLLMFMSILMIGSQIRPAQGNGIQEGLIGAGAYIGTSALVAAAINTYKPGTESTPFTPKTFVPAICAATAGIMAYNGEKTASTYFGLGALVTAILATVYSTTK
ncbi:hypothetical protein HYV10_02895 [Candidatus Dependentiae bacterium]|nr:hypothetical protein [Candidatus Dependentiae bacterium]